MIGVELGEESDDQWIVRISDTGAGIPKSDLKKLFKVEEKYTRRGLQGETGTGLGLPVCLEIMQQHSCSISVESEVGKGTTFLLKFQKLALHDEKKILVVDNEQGVRTLHTRYLKRIVPEVTIIHAADGKQAFELAQKYHPAPILSDYVMPALDGFELLDMLKKDLTTRSIPVIVITGEGSDSSKEALKLAGASEVLMKPISPGRLEMVLREHTPLLPDVSYGLQKES